MSIELHRHGHIQEIRLARPPVNALTPELRAKIVGMIQTPATRIAAVVNAPAGNLARVFGAYARKDEAA